MRTIVLLTVALFIGTAPVSAAFMWQIAATNTTGVDVFDIHVLISGTGGTIANLVGVLPAAQVIGSPNGNDIDAAWPVALPNGGVWKATFTTDHSPLRIEEMYWTDKLGLKIADVGQNDRTLEPVPEPATAGALAAAGMVLFLSRLRRHHLS